VSWANSQPICDPSYELPTYKGAVEVWYSSCNGVVVDFHDREDHTDKSVLARAIDPKMLFTWEQWQFVQVHIEADDDGTTSTIQVT
jgi:hypothetical protein